MPWRTNYRVISLNSIVSKILDYVLISLMKDKLSTNDMQFAYKREFSTLLCTCLVLETIQYCRGRGSSVFVLLLEASKPFDKVEDNKLFNLLISRKICPLVIRLLRNMYLINTDAVNWNRALSDDFEMA